MLPELHAVNSSNIAATGHDGTALYVKFHSGDVWKYPGVTAEHHEALRTAASVGKHFHQHIRGKFAGEKINEHA